MSRLDAIVPAAGRSRRMGRDKLLLPWGEGVVVGSVVEALLDGGVDRLVLVTAPRNESLLRWASDFDIETVVNPDPSRGMLSSIREGLATLAPAAELGVLVCPGDHAGLAAASVEALGAALGRGAGLVVPTHRGRRGHPLGIAARHLREVAELDAATGLKELLGHHPDEIVEVPVDDPAVTRDLDRPADYEAARRHASS